MLAARLVTAMGPCVRGVARVNLISKGNSTNVSLVRCLRQQTRFVGNQTTKQRFGSMEVGQIAVAGTAVVGMGALCFYGFGLSNEPGALELAMMYPQVVRDRIRTTYMYFGASCVATGASAVAIFRSPLGQQFCHACAQRPILSTIGMIAALIGTSQAMMSVPYTGGIGTKQALWLLNCGVLGLALAPIGAIGGAALIRAGWYTAGITGGLSTIAVCAPDGKFLSWGGPLSIGLGAVFAASIGTAFLPPTGALGLTMYSVAMYGGLAIFSGLLLYDTQKIIRKAETHPINSMYRFDPIANSHHIVMDVINIFMRIAMLNGGMKKK